jgi:hypothetical protein
VLADDNVGTDSFLRWDVPIWADIPECSDKPTGLLTEDSDGTPAIHNCMS